MKYINYITKGIALIMIMALVNVSDAQIAVSFSYTANNGIHFNPSVTGGLAPYSYAWSYGSPTTGSGTTRIYPSPGRYYVCVTVTDSLSATASFCDSITVPCSVAGFSHALTYPGTVTFTNTSNSSSLCTYSWYPGSGGHHFTKNVTYTYPGPGSYYACLTVYDSLSFCFDTYCDSIIIPTTPPCSTSFSYSVSGAVATFSALTSSSNPVRYSWTFGDGSSASPSLLPGKVHTYSSNGTYYVCLTAVDSVTKCTATFCDSVTISGIIPPPLCTAGYIKTQSHSAPVPPDTIGTAIPGQVDIFNTSTGSGLSYLWDFGDGTSSTAVSPTHTYAGNGPYILCLTVSNSSCSDTYCDSLSIDANGMLLKQGPGFTINVGGYALHHTGISDHSSFDNLEVYPNPADDVINIYFGTTSKEERIIQIFDLTGKETNSLTSFNNMEKINVSSLNPGIYLLRITSNSKTHTERVLIR